MLITKNRMHQFRNVLYQNDGCTYEHTVYVHVLLMVDYIERSESDSLQALL